MSKLARAICLSTLLTIGTAALAADLALYTTVDVTLDGYLMQSPGKAWLYDGAGGPSVVYRLTGQHMIVSSSYQIVANYSVKSDNTYENTLNASGTAGLCYEGKIDITADSGSGNTLTQGAGSASKCLPKPTDPLPTPGPSPGGGGSGSGGDTSTSGGKSNQDCSYTNEGCWSPIVVNLDSGGFRLSGTDDPVTFDIAADGHPLSISWTQRGAHVAFLAFDRNHNGKIDDGSELFGNHTPLLSGSIAADGFAALADFDVNHDAVIDSADPVWSDLLLWVDINHDGVSQSNELTPMSQSSVRSLALLHHFAGRRDRFGNVFKWEGLASPLYGGDKQPYYDVYFQSAR